MELSPSMVTQYTKLAKRHNAFVVIVKHQFTAPAMMGGKLPATLADAQAAADKMLANASFTDAWVIMPNGKVDAR